MICATIDREGVFTVTINFILFTRTTCKIEDDDPWTLYSVRSPVSSFMSIRISTKVKGRCRIIFMGQSLLDHQHQKWQFEMNLIVVDLIYSNLVVFTFSHPDELSTVDYVVKSNNNGQRCHIVITSHHTLTVRLYWSHGDDKRCQRTSSNIQLRSRLSHYYAMLMPWRIILYQYILA